MENASKALLIAGAVLIVILLIGIGMLIYSKATGVVDTAASSMNTQEIQMFNSQFTPYEGMQKGASVKSLISTIIANNATYKDNSNKQIQQFDFHSKQNSGETVYFTKDKDAASKLSKISATIVGTDNFTVSFSYDAKGLINRVAIGDK